MVKLDYTFSNALAIKLSGEFDAPAVKQFRDQFQSLTNIDMDIVFDLNSIHFIDSSALGVMVYLYKRLIAKGHQLSVIGMKGQPWSLFQSLHLDKAINSYETVDEYRRTHSIDSKLAKSALA